MRVVCGLETCFETVALLSGEAPLVMRDGCCCCCCCCQVYCRDMHDACNQLAEFRQRPREDLMIISILYWVQYFLGRGSVLLAFLLGRHTTRGTPQCIVARVRAYDMETHRDIGIPRRA
ncbi:hypothetical protein P171DRAFT_36289 [Karstenula rhodostoma CBS 690.94]|uniref:Uncharacterized protein n=1 Tax=Karstenula rhodostoma CBS 690.94 TaxID=1392251 RepID=A0A9P4PHD4_9PLEO|nr:hypothetical protein P171DRAFT_36289 [Karstenula rhodostoma CBS 690.94]